MKKAHIKTKKEVVIMAEGGKRLAEVKNKLLDKADSGVSAIEIEELAVGLIEKLGGKPSFMMVPDYYWATCVNVNSGLVHGIPKKEMVFKSGDIVSIDVGIYYKGFHTDTSTSKLIGTSQKKQAFLDAGRQALNAAISQAQVDNEVRDISRAMEKTLKSHKLSPVRALVGHGIGRELHEEPAIPCFVSGALSEYFKLRQGVVIAIEAMYAKGGPDIVIEDDGWTIGMKDAKISALFEETVAVGQSGPQILTT